MYLHHLFLYPSSVDLDIFTLPVTMWIQSSSRPFLLLMSVGWLQ